MAIFPGSAIQPAGAAGYTIDQSLRFNDNDSAYLNWTPASVGNQNTWTWSGWVKRGNIVSTYPSLFGGNTGSGGGDGIGFDSSHRLQMYFNGATTGNLVTNQVFRDSSAWYHIVLSIDTTQATSSNRVKIYINGEQVTSFATASYPAQNTNTYINYTNGHWIGRGYTGYLDAYLAEVHFIDGGALDPSFFGETDPTYGHWKPIAYTGSYGTNGFYLDFSNSSSIGEDQAGSNDWTANNLAATDVVLDSPTNNFCTWNALSAASGLVLSEGNLRTYYASASNRSAGATQSFTSGKWYWEVLASNVVGSFPLLGIAKHTEPGIRSLTGYYPGYTTESWGLYCNTGDFLNNASVLATYSTISTNDVMMFALDMDSGKYWMGKNGTWFNSGNPSAGTNAILSSGLSGQTITPMIAEYAGSIAVANFGQDSSFAGNKTAQNNTDDNGYGDFYYSPPSGFLALCTANLSDPAVVPRENFNTVLYTGNGSTQSITGVGFQPDFVWVKNRTSALNHVLSDAVRGANNALFSSLTNAEFNSTLNLTSFDSDGFSVGSGATVNNSGNSLVAWNWKADNTSGSSNTDGSITSTVAANVDAGFSIVGYTGTGANATVGHGLGVAPEMVICKSRSVSSTNWGVWHKDLTGSSYYLLLNSTAAQNTATTTMQANPSSTVLSLGTSSIFNASGTMIAYCFHSVDGYSKFGSYTGNGSTDGPFVYTGFRPAFVMFKLSSGSGHHWQIMDNSRPEYNPAGLELFANLDYAEQNAVTNNRSIDLLSNGFKVRGSNSNANTSGATYIYMAFAEYDFKHSNGR